MKFLNLIKKQSIKSEKKKNKNKPIAKILLNRERQGQSLGQKHGKDICSNNFLQQCPRSTRYYNKKRKRRGIQNRNKEIKLSLCAYDMITYAKADGIHKNLAELITDEFTEYKINTQDQYVSSRNNISIY